MYQYIYNEDTYKVCLEHIQPFEYLVNRLCGLDATSQPSKWTLLRILEQKVSRGVTQSPIKRYCVKLCTLRP